MYLNDIAPGERIAIVDDVLSTGGTLRAVIEGVKATGGTIAHILVVVEKGPGLKQLQADYPGITIQSLVRLEMNGADVVLLDD
jgi:adenine phosphoribosyltransferase